MFDKLNAVEARYGELATLLANPAVQSDAAKYREHAKALSEIEPLVDKYLPLVEPLWERGGGVRFSGTAIMEELHQQAERSAREALGVADYAVSCAAGAGYVRERLSAGPGGGALRLEIP